MTRLCTICARGGSTGVPKKNLRVLLGKPLIAHSVLQAKASGLFKKVAVSSDSPDILAAARKWGADILVRRPLSLASDRAAKIPAIRHCLLEAEKVSGIRYETVVDLDVTSPLRTTADIRAAVRLLEKKGVSGVITGAPARHSPYFNLVELNKKGVVVLSKKTNFSVVRRQDAPPCYDLNASVYVWTRSGLLAARSVFAKDTLLVVMPPERSIDIDSELDFEMVRNLMGKKRVSR